MVFYNLPSILEAHRLFWQEVMYPMLQEVRLTGQPFDPLKLEAGCLQVKFICCCCLSFIPSLLIFLFLTYALCFTVSWTFFCLLWILLGKGQKCGVYSQTTWHKSTFSHLHFGSVYHNCVKDIILKYQSSSHPICDILLLYNRYINNQSLNFLLPQFTKIR